MHALLHEGLGVQLFRHFHREFKVFAHEALESLGALRLPLFFVQHVVVVFDYFLYRLPILRDHFGGILRPLLNLMLHVLEFPLLLELLLLQLLLARPAVLLGIRRLLLGLPLEVFRHPLHLLYQEIPMGLRLLLLRLLLLGLACIVYRSP